MDVERVVQWLGAATAVILPLWNIPLIVRISRRRSSKDVSPSWALGVWVCLLLMLPAGLRSSDPVFRLFTVANVILFTGVVAQVLRFR